MNVAFRADASVSIGAGHVMRCAALAEALRGRGAMIRFISRELPPHLRQMLEERGFQIVDIGSVANAADAAATRSALADGVWDWLVVDHYGLDAAWESALRPQVARLLAIDDLANRSHTCDVLLDQNVHPQAAERYVGRVPPSCEQLLGPRYALLRDEFRQARPGAPRTGAVRRVLVSFGGGDAGNYTGLAVDALREAQVDAAVDVVLAANHPHRNEVEAACRQHGFTCHVQSTRMAELMAAADLAIGAVGSTTWERCCLGLPTLALAVAANQREVAEEAARRGLIYLVNGSRLAAATLAVHVRALLQNPTLREMLSRNGMQAVDGRGAERVARVLDRDSIRLRRATADDAAALLEWRNDEGVRAGARRSEPIAWPDHEAWLRTALTDDQRLLLIGERDGAPIGVVRLDINGAQAEMSLYRVPRSPGSGLASTLMLAAIDWLRANRPDLEELTGCVMGPNDRSHHLVRSTGWVLHSSNYTRQLRPS